MGNWDGLQATNPGTNLLFGYLARQHIVDLLGSTQIYSGIYSRPLTPGTWRRETRDQGPPKFGTKAQRRGPTARTLESLSAPEMEAPPEVVKKRQALNEEAFLKVLRAVMNQSDADSAYKKWRKEIMTAKKNGALQYDASMGNNPWDLGAGLQSTPSQMYIAQPVAAAMPASTPKGGAKKQRAGRKSSTASAVAVEEQAQQSNDNNPEAAMGSKGEHTATSAAVSSTASAVVVEEQAQKSTDNNPEAAMGSKGEHTIMRRVQRWWADENTWKEGVVTNYNPHENLIW
eukprot:gene30166-35146_t